MYNFIFVSANNGGGGSEELWVQAADALSRNGHNVVALTEWGSGASRRREQISHMRLKHLSLSGYSSFQSRALERIFCLDAGANRTLRRVIRESKPDLVIFNSGTLLDGIPLLETILAEKVPYVVVTHLVSTDNWPDDALAQRIHVAFSGALVTNFVSEHNRHLYFLQTGMTLSNSQIVRNPFLVKGQIKAMPQINQKAPIRLALPARLHPRTKGQDLLFETLSRKHWRDKGIHVTLFGCGTCEHSLRRLCLALGLNAKVTFSGHVDDMNHVWETHHGLILPSRHEGLPIAQIEAMWAGRVVIATPAGGIPEMLVDGHTGFLADGCNVDALDDALNKAFSELHRWESIGKNACEFIRGIIPENPVELWTDQLVELAKRN